MIRHAIGFSVVSGVMIFLGSGCAHQTIAIGSPEKAMVSVVDPATPEAPPKELGEAPIKLEVDAVKGKVLRIAMAGKQSQYFVIPDLAGTDTTINTKMDDLSNVGSNVPGQPATAADSVTSTNRLVRVLLRAYQALAQEQLDVAIQLSEEASKLSPGVAGPRIVQGLALMRAGRKPEARAAFEQAKALDPGDANIDELLQSVE